MGNRASAVRGGYDTDVPPDENCCAICYGDFRFPCKTSCGHWYCGNCILDLWEQSLDKTKPCDCLMCPSLITRLIPYSPQNTQLEVDVELGLFQIEDGILEKLDLYNHLNDEPSHFQKSVRLTKMLLHCFRDDDVNMHIVFYILCAFVAMLTLLYVRYCGYDSISGGSLMITACPPCFYVIMLIDAHLYRQRLLVEDSADLSLNVKVAIKRMMLCFREENMLMQANLVRLLMAMYLGIGILVQLYERYEFNFIPGGAITIITLPNCFLCVLFFMFVEGIWFRRRQRHLPNLHIE